MLKQILQGMVVGIANIIPGVSGGTMMVAMGLYDHLIHAITHLKSEFKKSMKLLIPIFLGAGIAIVVLSRLSAYYRESPIVGRYSREWTASTHRLLFSSLDTLFKWF